MTGPKKKWRMRLRHKVGASLSLAALLPVAVVSWVAVSVVFRSLANDMVRDTKRGLRVGVSLLLAEVQSLGKTADQLALHDGPLESVGGVGESELPPVLVQVMNAKGEQVLRRVVGTQASRFADIDAQPDDPTLLAGLAYERRAAFAIAKGRLVARAAAPIVDDSYTLRGVVVVSIPLDRRFAGGMKAALGAEVLFAPRAFQAFGDAAATFQISDGSHVRQVQVPGAAAVALKAGRMRYAQQHFVSGDYSIGYAPLVDSAGAVVGAFGYAVDRAPVVLARKAAIRSLLLGAAGSFIFALGLAGILTRRLSLPIARLHRGAVAIAQGDLDHTIDVPEGDEIGDLADAFQNMTRGLKENQRRLAARMREIVALHEAGRAMTSVIDLDQVLRKIVDQVARVQNAQVCGIWLTDDNAAGGIRLGAARAKRSDLRTTIRGSAGVALVIPLERIARHVVDTGEAVRIEQLMDHPQWSGAAEGSGASGSLMAVPLARQGRVSGVIIVARPSEAPQFKESEQSLLATFGDQAASAIDNARLYAEVRSFNEELEAKVAQRTQELRTMNNELGRALAELKEAEAQLVLSERLAGLGTLVAGVAHEINSPAAAIAGCSEAFAETAQRLTDYTQRLGNIEVSDEECVLFQTLAREAADELGNRPIPSPVLVRKIAKSLAARLESEGLESGAARALSRSLAALVPEPELLGRVADIVLGDDVGVELSERSRVLTGYLTEYVYLHRSASTIQTSIRRIQRIVRSLKSYTHLDQEELHEADIHAGIDDTLVILEHSLGRNIQVKREYGDLPKVQVYVDELNQVWTNLVHNAIHALEGRGTITIETDATADYITVRVIDDGPGIPPDVVDKIFEPFYTTKRKGEGTGLGLRIVRQIIDKHSGTIRVESKPGRTCFEIEIPRTAVGQSLGAAG